MVSSSPTVSHPPGHSYPVTDLLFVSQENDQEWIIENLIRPGDQVLLAGAPKSGKSLLGLQLALFVALGGKPKHTKRRFMFQQGAALEIDPVTGQPPENIIEVKTPRKVLYLSWEMGTRSVSARLSKQLEGLGFTMPSKSTPADPALNDLPLFHVFELPPPTGGKEPRRSLQVVVQSPNNRAKTAAEETFERKDDFEDLKALIKAAEPELVIIDTLIQMHQLNENSNIEMKAVMQAVRAACVRPSPKDREKEERVAHVILHHMRKEGPQSYGPSGAESMRGAGSIHSEADLALMLWKNNSQYNLTGSARDVAVDDLVLWRDKGSLLFWAESKADLGERFEGYLASLMFAFLSDQAVWSKPEGVSKGDAMVWIKNNAETVAEGVRWTKDTEVPENRITLLFERLATNGLIAALPIHTKGGRGKQKCYKLELNMPITEATVRDAVGRQQYRSASKRRRKTPASKVPKDTVTSEGLVNPAGNPKADGHEGGPPGSSLQPTS
ncbi:hypothetical protein Verru16b_03184 [Lacunisphaera limnophila]|uniref:Uncharacterized protein n=1 Tax=Lacunisphaera limnophila TaxID=1838286 RepID=A0A1D8AYW5_9BACT|nr:AAA family ATPase [Lacunisphaera limnophila]AOS46088.1 hypothetical protein Verru16b_03184 [Lacunisphaera limnophila]